jgi:protein TonB
MASELSVVCPERAAAAYPQLSRRLGESGTVVLRVELDEQGNVTDARVSNSSGFARLDDAAVAAVRGWRCTPASRNGQNVRGFAVQPFKFVIQGM